MSPTPITTRILELTRTLKLPGIRATFQEVLSTAANPSSISRVL